MEITEAMELVLMCSADCGTWVQGAVEGEEWEVRTVEEVGMEHRFPLQQIVADLESAGEQQWLARVRVEARDRLDCCSDGCWVLLESHWLHGTDGKPVNLHSHSDGPHRTESCPTGCGENPRHCSLALHLSNECPLRACLLYTSPSPRDS
eukprot:TRINITY_DN46547_c0_g1_i1.p1 TRINITY_DN46547_c0_g1~~TRINITY_DN46547_c0_g1_i1.p1  ORF type:complete len:150 (+),score=26.72 TRINITY_DN46547_c0_g1_i1:252-701(+)